MMLARNSVFPTKHKLKLLNLWIKNEMSSFLMIFGVLRQRDFFNGKNFSR